MGPLGAVGGGPNLRYHQRRLDRSDAAGQADIPSGHREDGYADDIVAVGMVGAALHPRDLGLVGYLGANAATLGDVLYVAGKYLPLLTEGTRVEVVATGERVRVEQHLLDPAGAGSRQVAGLGRAARHSQQ